MKNIMFYRRKYRNTSSRESAVHSGTLLVLFIIFLSGLLLGSALFYSGTSFSEISRKSAGFLLTRIPIRAGLTGLFFSVITVVCCLFFGLSPFGGVPLATLMLIKGVRSGITASMLLSEYAVRGLIYETLVILPGAAAAVYASLILAGLSMQLSQQTAQFVLRSGSAAPEIKKYLPQAGKACAVMIAANAVDAVATALFSGLF